MVYPQSDPASVPATSGKAIASLVLGLLSFCIPVLLAIPGLILGIISLKEIAASNGRLKGQGLAIGGIVTSSLGTFLAIPAILVALLLPAVQNVREAANRVRSSNNLKQIAIAMHNYDSTYNRVPPALVKPRGGPGLSWRVAILPFIEADGLYRQFHLDEPWDSPHNKSLLPMMPKIYAHPGQDPASKGHMTHYQVFVGPGSIFDEETTLSMGAVDRADGTSNTILVVEAADAVPWTKPQDLPYAANQPLPRLLPGRVSIIALADGSVRQLKSPVDDQLLRALITWNGKEKVTLP